MRNTAATSFLLCVAWMFSPSQDADTVGAISVAGLLEASRIVEVASSADGVLRSVGVRRGDRVSGWAADNRSAGFEKRGSSGPMNGSVDPSTAGQGAVGGRNDRVDCELSNVSLNQFEGPSVDLCAHSCLLKPLTREKGDDSEPSIGRACQSD